MQPSVNTNIKRKRPRTRGGKKVSYNITFLDSHDEFIDGTQVNELNEALIWDKFRELGHTKQPGHYFTYTEELQDLS